MNDLLDVCKEQIQAFTNILDENGIVTQKEGWFTFIDWCKELSSLTALQGVYLYTLDKFVNLLKDINDKDTLIYEKQLGQIRFASLHHLYDSESGLFVNGTDGFQKSVHSQVWMILGGVIEGAAAQNALSNMLNDPDTKQPFTPYMHHYVVEAMFKCGMHQKAIDYIKQIWGGMLEQDIDTFPEVYVPDDPDFSPYGDRMINSLCHAWSCSPAYFIRHHIKSL